MTGTTSQGLVFTGLSNSAISTGYPSWYHDTSYVPVYRKPKIEELFIAQILREETQNIQNLDKEMLNKMLSGSREDIMIAVELLKENTKYLWRIVHELKVKNAAIEDLGYIINDYVNNNIYRLNLNLNIE